MVFAIFGPITFIVCLITLISIWDKFSWEEKDVKGQILKTLILVVCLAVTWPFIVWGQITIWDNEEQVKQEKKEYYDKCIVEVENKINDKVQFYSKTDKCVK